MEADYREGKGSQFFGGLTQSVSFSATAKRSNWKPFLLSQPVGATPFFGMGNSFTPYGLGSFLASSISNALTKTFEKGCKVTTPHLPTIATACIHPEGITKHT